MATVLADPPPVEQDGPDTTAGAAVPAGAPATGQLPAAGARACPNCGAQLAAGQDWCLQCGTGAPGSVASGGLRPAALVAVITAALVLGAAAAGYAALSKKTRRATVVTTTVAQVSPPAATTPTTPALTTTTPASTQLPAITKPPKIPLKAVTPSSTTPATSTTTTGEKTASETGSATNSSGSGGAASEPEPILLDTDAATTYNPYEYPAAGFGDPSLTIDGDTSTAWTAQVNPATAPTLAEGVLIDLRTPQKVASIKLVTSTPGMTIQIFGANGKSAPDSITAKGWVALSHSMVVRKRHAHINLRDKNKSFRFLTLWISKAPVSSVGTTEDPGHVSVNELELFPPSS